MATKPTFTKYQGPSTIGEWSLTLVHQFFTAEHIDTTNHSSTHLTMILVPFPSLEQCVDHLADDRVRTQIDNCGHLIEWRYEGTYSTYWQYHFHEICNYRLLLLDKLKKKLGEHLWVRQVRTLEERFKQPKTGFPEWWGNMEIHNSHKQFMDSGYKGTLIAPKVRKLERLKRLQPIFKEHLRGLRTNSTRKH